LSRNGVKKIFAHVTLFITRSIFNKNIQIPNKRYFIYHKHARILDAITYPQKHCWIDDAVYLSENAPISTTSKGADLSDAIGILKYVVGLPAAASEWGSNFLMAEHPAFFL